MSDGYKGPGGATITVLHPSDPANYIPPPGSTSAADLAAEVTRAEGAEGTEVTRAEGAEGVNAAGLLAHKTSGDHDGRYPPIPQVGTFAAMPTSGTGSKKLYWASDDQGGTLYQDQTNGGPYTKIALGVGQTAGQELAYAEIQGNLTTNALALANRVDAAGLIVTAAVEIRPVVVTFMGSVFNTVVNQGVGIQIVEAGAGNANNTPIRQQTQMVSAGIAGAVMPVCLRVRLNPVPGNYTWKVMFNATVGGTATIGASATQPASLQVMTV